MKKLIFCAVASLGLVCLVQADGHAQFLKKLKDKVAQKVGDRISDKVADKAADAVGGPANTNNGMPGSTPGVGGPSNTMGGGLKNTTPPDVNQNINDAEKSTTAADYGNARFALQQAMTGVEIELGRQLLQSLPQTVSGLNKDTTKNLVQSLQYGWSNLTIQTAYTDGKDKQLKITIGNNPMYAGVVNMYFNNYTLIQNNGDNNNKMKQVRVKGNNGLIQYDASTGYQVFIQLSQSSMISWECVNFATEDEVMAAVNSFDVDGIKKTMGEQ